MVDSITIGDLIFSRELPWALQISQNVLSMAGMIPVRVYNYTKAKLIFDKFFAKFYFERDLSELFSKNEFDFLKFIRVQNIEAKKSDESIAQFFRNEGNSPWVSLPSNEHPLISEFRRSICFRAWEQLLVYTVIKDNQEHFNLCKPVFKPILKEMILGLHKINKLPEDVFLIVGPLFTPPEHETGEIFYDTRVKLVVKEISEALRGDLKNVISIDRYWAVRGSMRPWIDENDLVEILLFTSKALSSIFLTRYHKPFVISRCILRRIALTAWILYSRTLENAISMISLSQDYSCSFDKMLDNISVKVAIDESIGNFLKMLNCTWNDGFWSIELTKSTIENKRRIYIEVDEKLKKKNPSWFSGKRYEKNFNFRKLIDMDFSEEDDGDPIHAAESILTTLYRGVDRRVISLEQGYTQERTNLLMEWFNRELGIFSGETDNDYFHQFNKLCKGVTKEVNRLLSSDFCNIYRYNHQKGTVSLAAYWPKNQRICEMLKATEEIDKKDDRREKGITFRAIDSKEPRFCRAVYFDENNRPLFDPPNETLLESILPFARSAISAPLIVQDRVLGHIGISGKSPHQFRFENTQLLSRIGRIFSPYLYNSLLLSSLGNMTRIVTNRKGKSVEILSEICNEFTNIFLCFGATLWMPQRTKPNRFTPVGWSKNRNELNSMIESIPGGIFTDINEPDSIISRGINTMKISKLSFGHCSIKDATDKDPGWYGKNELRKWLRLNEIESATVIPIESPQNNELISVMCLYHQTDGDGPLNEYWQSAISFMSYFLALLQEALAYQERWEKTIRDIIAHDMAQQIGAISDRCDDLSSGLPKSFNVPIVTKLAHINTPIYKIIMDIQHHQKHLNRLISVFQNEYTFDIIRHSRVHPFYVLHKIDPIKPEIINIRKQYYDVLSPSVQTRHDKHLTEEYIGPRTGPYMLLPPSYFQEILYNLIQNAVKYAIPNSEIVANVEITKYSVLFCLTNIGITLNVDEETSIFQENYRGSNAIDVPGQGKGLHNAWIYANLLESELHLDTEPFGNFMKFTFVLTLPKTKLN